MIPISRRQPDVRESDQALVDRVLDGDRGAFTQLYQRHASGIAAFVYRLLGNDAELDDIVQETFVQAYSGLGRIADRSKVRSYLLTIAVRRVHARLSWTYRVRGLADRLFGVAPMVSDPKTAEPVHDLYRSLQRVDPRHRIAWVLHRVEGHTLPEVATRCDISLATTKRWVADVDSRVEVDLESR